MLFIRSNMKFKWSSGLVWSGTDELLVWLSVHVWKSRCIFKLNVWRASGIAMLSDYRIYYLSHFIEPSAIFTTYYQSNGSTAPDTFK